jgi:uncharacterized protein
MRGLRRAGRVAALAAALPLTGCAAFFGGYDLAPNGLPRDEDAFRRALAFEAPRAYDSALRGTRSLPEDELLRLLYAGIAGRYAGAYEESSRLLDVASYLAEDRVTTSVSREVLSLVTSEQALAYVPSPTERLMLHYVAALNFLDAGDYHGAAVEARRIEALLDRLHDDTPYEERPEGHRLLHYLTGSIFEAAGDWNAADVAFRRAALTGGGAATPWEHAPAADSTGDVVVLVERGFVAHRVEQSVVIALPPDRAAKLSGGSVGERTGAALEAAAAILLAASVHFGDRSGYYHDPGYRSTVRLDPWRDDGRRDDDNGAPYLLRIAWPVLYQEPLPPAPLRVRAGEFGADAMAGFDVSAGVRRDFDAQRPAMVARAVTRAAAKLALASAVEKSVSKRDETAGEVAGVLTNVATALAERADTRGWHLLPGAVSMVRLRLPAGTHELVTEAPGGDRAETLATVTVRPGQTTFVTSRLWR